MSGNEHVEPSNVKLIELIELIDRGESKSNIVDLSIRNIGDGNNAILYQSEFHQPSKIRILAGEVITAEFKINEILKGNDFFKAIMESEANVNDVLASNFKSPHLIQSSFKALEASMLQYEASINRLIVALPEKPIIKILRGDLIRMSSLRNNANKLLVLLDGWLPLIQVENKIVDKMKEISLIESHLSVEKKHHLSNRREFNVVEYQSYVVKLSENNDKLRAVLTLKDEIKLKGGYDKSQLMILEQKIKTLDDEYHFISLSLKRFDIQARKQGGYPEEGGYSSLEAWSSWTTQNTKLPLTSNYRPSLQELLFERQLAGNNMSSIFEAYSALFYTCAGADTTELSEETSVSRSQKIWAALNGLDQWLLSHPIEAIELAGNVEHAYALIMQKPETFGEQLVESVKTTWKRGSVESQIHDILLGEREEIPSRASTKMTAEMIALLNIAQMAPYVIGGIKGARGQGALARAGMAVTSVFASPVLSPVIGFIGGLLEVKVQKVYLITDKSQP
ncbi:hypothetical protein [Shewanella surugensis]|uniref:Uncharacterized protein n=1 Tax=Shewanella surugensis TaxID=212020 RepID=A0ABT0LL36_9GAMM|nr:hypothetical protein [Shewanella surugensis]MCL1128007.1 hypothetical protein [Shewanella surugensis]